MSLRRASFRSRPERRSFFYPLITSTMKLSTLNLPVTAFNQRANGAQREPELLAFWQQHQVFERRSARNSGPRFTLHDGPPYANGGVHLGHVLNKTLKDVLNKYHLLRGRQVTFVPGWDCHGLPTELQATKKKRYDQVDELRNACAQTAAVYVSEQREALQRLGLSGRWEAPYLTMAPEYEARELSVFAELFFKGLVYRASKPTYYSPSTKTVLAEAELDYQLREDLAAYCAFPLADGTRLVAWTTMPWTLLGNQALALHPTLPYATVASPRGQLVVAADLVDRLAQEWGEPLTVLTTAPGCAWEGANYRNPLTGTDHSVVCDPFVSAATGTGVVHLCPAHGLDDYVVGQRFELPLQAVATQQGTFGPEYGELAGLPVLGEGTRQLLGQATALGMVVHQHGYQHSYPHDWRSCQPVLVLPSQQFFVDVAQLRDPALRALQEVKIANPVHRNRLESMLRTRQDWCVSRQRKWGLPLPVFVHESGELLLTPETLAHLLPLVRAQGSNVWFTASVADLLPPSYRDRAHEYEKVLDTLDVWFDSGSSWAAVLQADGQLDAVADMYFEGSDQHRGWFQSSLLTSVALMGRAPYRELVTHGFVLDEHGSKMSKSKGNVVTPQQVVQQYNADVLRLWAVSADYTEDVKVGATVLQQMADAYFRLRNTFRYLLGNLADYVPTEATPAALSPKDQRMLGQLAAYHEAMLAGYEAHDFRVVFQLTMNFFTTLSRDYLDLPTKALLYEAASNDPERRNTQYVFTCLLDKLLPLLTPLVPFLCEDAHQHRLDKTAVSVFDLAL
jgi:isoleucyl-tRNA synthetase